MFDDRVKSSQNKVEKLTKRDKIKRFSKKYWLPITVGVISITVTYIVTRRVTLRNMPEVLEEVSIDFLNKPMGKLIEVEVPQTKIGNNVFNTDSRIGFFSQEAAAKTYEVPRVFVDQQLKWNVPTWGVKEEISQLQRTNLRIFAEVEK